MRFIDDPSGYAVSAENRYRALWDFVQFVDETRALCGQLLDDMSVVNNLVTHVNWRAMHRQRPLDNINGPHDTRAKPPRLGKNNLHSLLLLPRVRLETPLIPPLCAVRQFPKPKFYAAKNA